MLQLPAGEQVIVVARELAPGLTVQLDRDHVLALVSEEGHPHLSRRHPGPLTRAFPPSWAPLVRWT